MRKAIDMSFQTSCAILAILPALSCAASAHADAFDPVRQETVRFDDLDLTSPSGARHLGLRVEGAARNVCATTDRLEELRCRRDAVARATANLVRVRPALKASALGPQANPLLAVPHGEGSDR